MLKRSHNHQMCHQPSQIRSSIRRRQFWIIVMSAALLWSSLSLFNQQLGTLSQARQSQFVESQAETLTGDNLIQLEPSQSMPIDIVNPGIKVGSINGRGLPENPVPAGLSNEDWDTIQARIEAARSPLVGDPLLRREVTTLRASDAKQDDRFGKSVSLSGDTVVVGAIKEDGGPGDPTGDAGVAYVYERNRGGADNWGEVAILRASDAQTDDRFGTSVSISGDTIVVGAWQENGGAGDPAFQSGAAYVYERNQGGADNWGEVAILRASDAQASDWFGSSVSISGDTIVVGAHGEDGGPGDPIGGSGAAYVYGRNEGGADNWGQVTVIRASDAQTGDRFGDAVAIHGDIIAVAAGGENGGAGDPIDNAGAVYVYERSRGGVDNWGQVTVLRASDAQARDSFGSSVSISGDTMVVGAGLEDGGPGDPIAGAGAVYVYERNEGGADNWGQVTVLRASDAQEDDRFGRAVSISGDTIVVDSYWEDGGPGDPLEDAGAAYVYERNAGGADNWGEVAILRAGDAQAGDWFSESVGVSGGTIVLGASWEDGGAGNSTSDSGAAYIFVTEDGTWQETAIARASDAQMFDRLGWSVSADGGIVAVGAFLEDGGAGDPIAGAGAVYLFERNQGGADNWGEVKILRASDPQMTDEFGYSVSINGDTLAVGAFGEDGGPGDPAPSTGAVYVYERNRGGADNWGEVAILRASDAQASDNFSAVVSISGDTIVVAASSEDGGSGDPLENAGAVYVYERNQGGADNWGEVTILPASDAQASDIFGESVSISGNTIVVGAKFEDGGFGDPRDAAGAAYVFARNEGGLNNWGEVAILRAGDAQAGDNFGKSVSISGDTIVVGAWAEGGGAGSPTPASGAAYVFERNQGGADNWGEVAILRASDAQSGDVLGREISINGDTVVVGAYAEDGGAGDPAANAGAAYIFARNKGGADNWGEVKILRAGDFQMNDEFGWSIRISENVIVVGASNEDGGVGNPADNAGAAYIFAPAPISRDLGLSKSVQPSTVVSGQAMTYTLALSYTGNVLASNAVITDILPVNLTNVTITSSGVIITDSGISPGYVWQVQNLTSGQSGFITITGHLTNPPVLGPITNTALIASDATDTNPANNTVQAIFTATEVGGTAGLIGGTLTLDLAPGRTRAVTIQVNGGNLIIHAPFNLLEAGPGTNLVDANTLSIPLANISGSIQVNGSDNDDELTLDFSGGGEFLNAIPLIFDGGDQATQGDSLHLINMVLFDQIIFGYRNLSDGSILVGNNFISYTGLEPIFADGSAMTMTFNLSDTADLATLTDLGGSMSRLAGDTFEDTDFANPQADGTLRFNLTGGDDQLTITSLSLNPGTHLIVDGQAGSDSVIWNTSNRIISSSPFSATFDADLTVNSGIIFRAILSGTTPGQGYDQVIIQGDSHTVSLAGASLAVSLGSGFTPTLGDEFLLINNLVADSGFSGTFNNLPEGARLTIDGYLFRLSYQGGPDKNDLVLTRSDSVPIYLPLVISKQ